VGDSGLLGEARQPGVHGVAVSEVHGHAERRLGALGGGGQRVEYGERRAGRGGSGAGVERDGEVVVAGAEVVVAGAEVVEADGGGALCVAGGAGVDGPVLLVGDLPAGRAGGAGQGAQVDLCLPPCEDQGGRGDEVGRGVALEAAGAQQVLAAAGGGHGEAVEPETRSGVLAEDAVVEGGLSGLGGVGPGLLGPAVAAAGEGVPLAPVGAEGDLCPEVRQSVGLGPGGELVGGGRLHGHRLGEEAVHVGFAGAVVDDLQGAVAVLGGGVGGEGDLGSSVDAEDDALLEELGAAETLALRGEAAVASARPWDRVYDEVVRRRHWRAPAAARRLVLCGDTLMGRHRAAGKRSSTVRGAQYEAAAGGTRSRPAYGRHSSRRGRGSRGHR
jgi:hypothetical protein